jgi:hypothetical protein
MALVFMAFMAAMLYGFGALRSPSVANAIGFHVVLPPEHVWTALGSSEWTEKRDFSVAEPCHIAIQRLETRRSGQLKSAHPLEAPWGEKILLPAGSTHRIVLPELGALGLPTSPHIIYRVDTADGAWSITTDYLTEAEAHALARSFTIP